MITQNNGHQMPILAICYVKQIIHKTVAYEALENQYVKNKHEAETIR